MNKLRDLLQCYGDDENNITFSTYHAAALIIYKCWQNIWLRDTAGQNKTGC